MNDQKNEEKDFFPAVTGLRSVYFVGIGGIGMSAIARFFHSKGVSVSGYDKTPTTQNWWCIHRQFQKIIQNCCFTSRMDTKW
jgi:UDP-N-acetylmuramate-alanine ligase